MCFEPLLKELTAHLQKIVVLQILNDRQLDALRLHFSLQDLFITDNVVKHELLMSWLNVELPTRPFLRNVRG